MGEVRFKTSGSTGVAKEVLRSEESLLADATALVAQFPEIWMSKPVVVASIPSDHMYGALWRVRAPKIAGCFVHPTTELSVEGLIAAKEKYGRYLLVTTPSFLEKLVNHSEINRLKGGVIDVVTSGSLLRSETAIAVNQLLGVCPLEIFGSTETGTVAYRRQTEGDAWTLVQNISVEINDENRLVVDSPYAMTSPYVMSDGVELLPNRQFLLKGRTDRKVKILEELVDITRVEDIFESHPFVNRVRIEAFGDSVVRLGALVVLAEECLGKSNAEILAGLRHDLIEKTGNIAYPRRIRFVRSLPVDERGKITSANVKSLLQNWCREPRVYEWHQTNDELKAKLLFMSDMECFAGHFPDFPVLPGVAQLYFVRHFARQAFADYPEAITYKRLKFQKLILPEMLVELSVVRKAEGEFDFNLVGPNGMCSSGLAERCEL